MQTSAFSDKRAFAKQYGYKLKIDYVNDAVTAFINQLKPLMDKAPNYYNVSINTFGTSFNQLQSMTNNSTVLQTAAGKIDIESATPSSSNFGFSYAANALEKSLVGVTNIGDGSSPNSRKTYFIFLSDGAQDVASSEFPYNRTVDVNYAAACAALKAAGAAANKTTNPVMFSIDATYYPLPGDSQYNQLISSKGLETDMPATMKACATPSAQYQTYFQASDGPAITLAAQQVFDSIFGNGTLHISR